MKKNTYPLLLPLAAIARSSVALPARYPAVRRLLATAGLTTAFLAAAISSPAQTLSSRS
jgi:hypothetical protein